MANQEITANSHADAATALIEKLRALRNEFPRFVEAAAVPDAERARIDKQSLVSPSGLESVTVAIKAEPKLETAIGGGNAATLRDAALYALAFDEVVQELRSFTRSAALSVRIQRAEAGGAALDVLAMARRLAKRKNGAFLRPHVENMERKIVRKARKTNSNPVPATTDPQAPQRTA